MRVVIAPDKFKGTLTATAAAEAIAGGWQRARPQDELRLFPISDGGDGFGELLARHLHAEERQVETVNAAHVPISAPWWWAQRQRLAIIESARVIGLAMLPPGQFHPFALDTFGLGAVMRAAAALHPRTCMLGIGGSATNDGGFGLARALGWRFLDRKGHALERWIDLPASTRLEQPERTLRCGTLLVAVDVQNRLLGKYGATQIYGPQKGIGPEDMKFTERCLRRLVRLIKVIRPAFRRPDHAPEHRRGAGAAGGLGFGLFCFAQGRLEPGFRLFTRLSGLSDELRAADLVITGEGAIDLSTLAMGKGVGQLMAVCGRMHRTFLAFAGKVEVRRAQRARLAGLYAITPTLATPDEAVARPAHWLAELSHRAAQDWTARHP